MPDTRFSVPASKLNRLPAIGQLNHDTGALEFYDGVEDSRWSCPPIFPAGRGGLVSTIDDYFAFGQMLLNGGKHGKQRILSRPSVAAMTTDQLTPEQKAASSTLPFFLGNRGWGFGLSVITERDGVASSPGRFGWDGGVCASWYADPSEQMLGVLMSQQITSFSLIGDFWTSVYQAIDD